MLQMNHKHISFGGVSAIDEVTVARMDASFSGAEVHFNMAIGDLDVYAAYKDVVEADFSAFKEAVITKIAKINEIDHNENEGEE